MSSGEYGQGEQEPGDAAGRLPAERCRVVAQLGRGGMGVVRRAVDPLDVWWATTDDDSGTTDVHISDVHLVGGGTDPPVHGLPVR
ncbi:hypothetical protein [Streptomyces sp. NPDC050287]|uniref:hypothetical protein n=1 Tax=Streptomyces sp. NPDC050287 TaxID=3365608 RepID=UPI00379C50F9